MRTVTITKILLSFLLKFLKSALGKENQDTSRIMQKELKQPTDEMKMKELKNMIKCHEGYRKFPYRCSAGKLTIGWGHNLEDNGISVEVAEQMLDEDIQRAYKDITYVFPDFQNFSRNRQNALIDMLFNLGLTKFCLFTKMIEAVRKGDWSRAAKEAKDSKWHNQVGSRAVEIENLLRKG